MIRWSTFLLCLLFSVLCSAQNRTDFEYDGQSLQEVLQDLEQEFQVVFSYTTDIVVDKSVYHSSSGRDLEFILSSILASFYLEYNHYEQSYIVITKIEKPTWQLCGTVLDEEGLALAFATIYIGRLQIAHSCDDQGQFSWNCSAYGDETVSIRYIGYKEYTCSIGELLDCPTITLEMDLISFEEIVVKEYVTSGIEQSEDLDHIILRPKKIDMIPGLTDADVLHMAQLLPGIKSIDESASGLYVRGGTPDQNLILYDRIPVYNSGHFFGMISGINPSLVDQVKIYRNGFSPKYGGRASSVIDIASMDKIPTNIQLDAGINFTHGDASLTVPLWKEKAALVVGARKSYTEIIETPTYRRLSERVFRRGKFDDLNEDEDLPVETVLDFNFSDYNAKLLLRPTKKDQVSLSFFSLHDRLIFDFTDVEDDFQTVDRIQLQSYGLSAIWKRTWSDRFRSEIFSTGTVYSNEYSLNILDGDEEDHLEELQLNRVEDISYHWNNDWDLNRHIHLQFGIQYADLAVERFYQFEDEETEIDLENDENEILTGHLSVHSIFNKRFKSTFGIRWNHAFSTAESFWEPRFSMQYLPFKHVQLNASAGIYRQFMSQVLEFNDLGLNQDFWVLSDIEENSAVVLSKNFSAGMIYYPSSFILEIDGYFKQQDGLAANFSNFQESDIGDFEIGQANIWGIDVLLKKRWNQFQSWILYSYNRTFYTLELDNAFIQFRAPHDVPHSFRMTHQYDGSWFSVSAGWNISSGIPYTPVFELDEDEEGALVYEQDQINIERLPMTHRLDISAMFQLFKKNGWKGSLGCSILNVYNQENIMGREYFSIYDDDLELYELQERDRNMLRFTPNVVFRIQFD